ncbi:MAG: hypothetical protein AB9866_00825 [Syntrophobacteraceae bacterium]
MIRWKVVVVVILALCTAACGPKKPSLFPLIMIVDIRPSPSANKGEIFWMVIKEVDENQFSHDSYEAIESIVQADDWGPDVLAVCPVIPGQNKRITINKPTYRPAGFYFTFTEPQEYWKVLLRQPLKSSKYRLHIEQYKAYLEPFGSTW